MLTRVDVFVSMRRCTNQLHTTHFIHENKQTKIERRDVHIHKSEETHFPCEQQVHYNQKLKESLKLP